MIYSFGPKGGLVKLTMCAEVCHVDERMSILLIVETEFKIPQSRNRPINRSTWIRAAPISKLVAMSVYINWSFSFYFCLFKVMPRPAQSPWIEKPRSLIISCSGSTKYTAPHCSVIFKSEIDPGNMSLKTIPPPCGDSLNVFVIRKHQLIQFKVWSTLEFELSCMNY